MILALSTSLRDTLHPPHQGARPLGRITLVAKDGLKTIVPLLLDELGDEFDRSYDSKAKLSRLHERSSKIKVFDPTRGAGMSFLPRDKRADLYDGEELAG